MHLDQALEFKQIVRDRFLNADLLAASEPLGQLDRSRAVPQRDWQRVKLAHKYLNPSAHVSLGIERADGMQGEDFQLVVGYGHTRMLPVVRRIQDFARDRGQRVRAVRIGRVRLVSGPSRPLAIGCSVSHVRASSGSLGCFVKHGGSSEPCLLSNSHVLGGVTGRPGDFVRHPGLGSKERPPYRTVARLFKSVPIDFSAGAGNAADCATAQIRERADVPADPAALPPLPRPRTDGAVPPSRLTGVVTERPRLNQIVWKFGAASGWTCGMIATLEQDVRVTFDTRDGRRMAQFKNQIGVAGIRGAGAFAKPGDSGSVVLLPDGNILGIVFARSDTSDEGPLVFVNPIKQALDGLGVAILLQ